jgi:hypothetical protein
MRIGFVGFFLALVLAQARPVIFWQPDSTAPGNVVLLAGGGLAGCTKAAVAPQFDSDQAGSPTLVDMIQPSEQSVKFLLPASFKPGIFRVQVRCGTEETRPIYLNRPEVWFLQPTILLPGLKENETAPNTEVQIIGKDFLLPGDIGKTRAEIRQKGKAWTALDVTRPERFSLHAKIPPHLASGVYELRISNGFGGGSGWSPILPIEIKTIDSWPARVFDVKKDFGARGDDVTDDTDSIEKALSAARSHGGGIVYLPWGIYRLSRWVAIPPHTILRGESRNASVLMWPEDEPKSLEEFTQAAVFGQAPYAVEDLSLIARKVNILLEDTTFGQGVPAELRPAPGANPAHDVFIRRVNLQHWLLAGHPDRNPVLWNTPAKGASKANGDGATTFALNGVTNFEMSDVESQGGQIRIRNISNARETGNQVGNSMGYCWAEMGGGAHYVVSENNELRASTSWGYGNTALKYVYSAHNKSYNFVRGEREAMTLDISALPTARPGGNIAWFGKAVKVNGVSFTIDGIKAKPDEFAGLDIMILDGPGKGQFRSIASNTPTVFNVDRPWDVQPDENSTLGLWSVMQHMIVYKSEGEDTSAFAQLWGSFYDYIVDSCRVERNQGIWGQSGWFVQFRYNEVSYANSYHPGIGPSGPTPEKTMPFSFMGLTSGVLRVTKFGSTQYGRPLVMVDDVAGEQVPGAFGAIVKGNVLKYNQRISFPPSVELVPRGKNDARMFDVVIDGNRIEHSAVGIQIGPQVRGAVLSGNRFEDVKDRYGIAVPAQALVIDQK